jgi:N-acetylmuramoyl-L-alanine amidase
VTPSARIAAAAICAALCTLAPLTSAAAFAVPVTPSQPQVWVAGRQIPFTHLAIAYGDPVVPVDDPGLQAMLAAVVARSSWQPGTRFVAITRADGKLVTFTLGSNAVSVDGSPSSMPFAPFTDGAHFYLPLLPLARALDLGVRGFHAGYVFVPQVVSVTPRIEGQRLTIRVVGSAPLTWRSAFSANASSRTLTLSLPGFGTDAAGVQPLAGAIASSVAVSESGPPGYPTTSIAVSVARGAKFVARRVGVGAAVDIVLARTDAALRAAAPKSTPSAVRVVVQPIATPEPSPSPTTVMVPATAQPTPAMGPGPETSGSPSAVATAVPLGPEPTSSAASATPVAAFSAPPLVEQKITDVSVAETSVGTRITLTLTGPVAFEWHRLGDPDDRYWLDIDRAQLVGPAQALVSKLAFIKEIKISQHALVPDKVVRLSITPTQEIDVRVGTIQGSPNQLGIEIENQPPAPDAPMAGIGSSIVVANAASPTPSFSPRPVQPNLIVIDPGHGGSDPGSINPAYGLTESTLTMAISRRLAADLKKQGWQVTMTRDGDYDVGDPNGPDAQELQARCDVANASGARLFVSVHINSSVSSAPNGATTYYWHPQDRALAQAVQNDVIAAVGIADDGVKRNNFYVIHHTVMASILVEVAYLSNPHDATLLTESSFLDKIAAGIAHGIGDFTGGP